MSDFHVCKPHTQEQQKIYAVVSRGNPVGKRILEEEEHRKYYDYITSEIRL
jgi:hypothetical protein